MGFIPSNNPPSPVAIRDARVSLLRLQALHPKFIPSAIQFILDSEAALNLTLRVSQGLRTFSQQTDLYNQGRFGNPGPILTYAPAGESAHNYGIAIDICIVNPDSSIDWNFDYTQLVPYATNNGLTCGINFPPNEIDRDHFENFYGYTWQELLAKYNTGDFISGTSFVNI